MNGRRMYRDPDRDYDGECQEAAYTDGELIEQEVASVLMVVRLPETWRAQALTTVGAASEADQVERRRKRAESKHSRANELYRESLIGRSEYDRRVLEARAELDALKPVPNLDLERASELLNDLPRLYLMATPAERQRLFQVMLERAFIRSKHVVAIQPTPELYALLSKFTADPTGFEPAVSALTGPRVGPATPRVQYREMEYTIPIRRRQSRSIKIRSI